MKNDPSINYEKYYYTNENNQVITFDFEPRYSQLITLINMVKTTGLSEEYIENMDYSDFLFAKELTYKIMEKEAKELKKIKSKT